MGCHEARGWARDVAHLRENRRFKRVGHNSPRGSHGALRQVVGMGDKPAGEVSREEGRQQEADELISEDLRAEDAGSGSRLCGVCRLTARRQFSS